MTSATPRYTPDTNWQRRINWLALRGFGNSGVGAATMATPFIGYLILYHDAIRPYLGGLGGLLSHDGAATCGPWVGFETRLHLLYFGLLCLGIGTIIFRAAADSAIKSHNGVSDYIAQNADFMSLRNLRSMIVTIRARRPGMGQDLVRRGPWLDRKAVPDLKAAVARAQEDPAAEAALKLDVMRSYFNVLDRYSARPWVWAAAILYGLGFSLLAAPGLAFTVRVVCTILT